MAEYHVGIDFSGTIYAGTLTKDKKRWINKSDVTDEVVVAFWAWLQEQYEESAEETELECGQSIERTISYLDSEYEIVFRKKKRVVSVMAKFDLRLTLHFKGDMAYIDTKNITDMEEALNELAANKAIKEQSD